MISATILLIEGNPLTRKLVRGALEKQGYSVLEAANGKGALSILEASPADLILQDVVLPDIDGFELVSRLRALPHAGNASILAFSGLLSNLDQERLASSGFDDVIAKPIEPWRLIPILEAHLSGRAPGAEQVGEGRRLVLADDEPSQLKLTRFRLERMGFTVEAVSDGLQALEAARRECPDGIVSDVLMPNLDGFGLALAVRQDSELKDVPVVLLTSSYVDASDRELARRAGASDLVLRTPSHRELFHALKRMLQQPVARAQPEGLLELEQERSERVIRQLERQVLLNRGLARRCSALAVELAVLSGISEAVVKHTDIEVALTEAFAACLDVGGIATGALYVLQPDGSLRVRSLMELSVADGDPLKDCWGHQVELRELILTGTTTVFVAGTPGVEWAGEVLASTGANLALLVPLLGRDGVSGALFLAISSPDSDPEDWRVFGQAIANQVAQALTLANSFAERESAERNAREQSQLLLESEQRFRATFEHAAVGVAQVAPDGRWLDVNQRFTEIVGYSREELLERTFQSITYPPDLPTNLEWMRKVLDGEISNYSMEKRYVRKDGELVWVALTVALVRDTDGSPKYFIPVIQDISARKKAEEELERTAAQLRQAQKMEAVGQLAGGIAHDFNNILSVIQSYGGLVLNDLPSDHPARADIEQMVRAGERAANLTRQLLIFSRRQVVTPIVVDVNVSIDGLGRMLGRLIGEDIEFGVQARATGRVLIDPGQLEQIIMNLVVNARDAMPTGGKLRIETRDVQLDARYAEHELGLRAGRFVQLSVKDTGIGMDAATQGRIFEPFFTTKGPGKGTGLGLSTVFGIVKQCGGAIAVNSELGGGTTFSIYLPCVSARERLSDAPPAPGKSLGGGETVLLVEDDDQVRKLSRKVLEKYGYHVLAAENAEQALRLASEFDAPIHLLLTDVVMPRVGGRQLAEQLSELRPGIGVLFMSGYTDDAVVHHGVLASEIAFLQKPFMPRTLLAKVREVLDQVPATLAARER